MTKGEYEILGLLPVRGESLGLPGKNSRELHGRPLMGWAARALKDSLDVDYAFCSTDSLKLAQIAENYGLKTYPLRPSNLAGPESLVRDTVSCVLEEHSRKGRNYDQVVLVQATSPFVTTSDISRVVAALRERSVDSAVSVTKVPDDYHPSLMYRSSGGQLLIAGDPEETFRRRQDRSSWFRRVGLVVGFKVDFFKDQGQLVGGNVRFIEVEPDRGINIDDEDDFASAEQIAERYL